MIDRFNFFDVYGYLLPGGFLLALLWLPFGLVLGKWPPASWGSAALAIAMAYIGGHLLRIFAESAFSSKIKDPQGNRRYPSDLLLDRTAPGNLKYRLEAQIRSAFGPDIDVDATQWSEPLGMRRNTAFFKCRSFLIGKKAAVYTEQQQGMYELLRGITGALAMASAFYFGLGAGFLARNWQECTQFVCAIQAVFFVIVALIVIGALASAVCGLWPPLNEWARWWAFYLFGGMLFCVGAFVAFIDHTGRLAGFAPDANNRITIAMFVLWAVSLVLAVHCFDAFRRFAMSFARTVYQDFSALASTPTEDDTRRRAYRIYTQPGMPPGMAEQHWHLAEEQLRG